jgi:hypothetical protein
LFLLRIGTNDRLFKDSNKYWDYIKLKEFLQYLSDTWNLKETAPWSSLRSQLPPGLNYALHLNAVTYWFVCGLKEELSCRILPVSLIEMR